MKRTLGVLLSVLPWLPAVPCRAAEKPDKPSFEQYLRQTAVPREVIDVFLRGPSWAQYDHELGYILGNYLPSDGMDGSATISTVQSNGARTSFVYAGRDFYVDDSLFGYSRRTFAFFAGVCNNLPGSSALGAGRDHLEEAAASCDLPGSAAGWASARLGSRCTAAAGAFGAGVLAGELDGFFSAFGDVVQCQVDGGFQVIATSGAASVCSCTHSKKVTESSEA